MKKLYRYGSLFSGAGSKDIGAEQAGFTKLFSVENNSHAHLCLEKNWNGVTNFLDILKVTPDEIKQVMAGDLDLLALSPPCVGFSLANPCRDPGNPHNDLTFKAIPLIDAINPKVFVIENVPGMMTGKMKDSFERIKEKLRRLGYICQGKVMNSLHYGVPQWRDRVIIVGVRDDLQGDFVYPEPDLKGVMQLRMLDVLPHIEAFKR